MSNTPSKAIYLGGKGELSIRYVNDKYTPTGSQSLVAVKYSAINPADLRHAYMGMHSSIAGYEWIGPVVAVGPTSPYRVGDILFGLSKYGENRPFHRGAHQDFLLADPLCTYRVPEDMISPADEEVKRKTWPQVVSWTVGVQTATDMLFNELGFAFPGIKGLETGTDPTGRAILIVSPTF
jgi:NADPH:quinone reductase-like Zn-dependent oxidoreductase